MSFTLSDGTVIQLYDYRFVHADWQPPVEDPPLKWTRINQGEWADPPGPVGSLTSGMPAGPEGPTVIVHPLIYSHYRMVIDLSSVNAQLEVFRYRAQSKPEDDDQFHKLVAIANTACAQTLSSTRTQLVRVEVR